MVVATKKADWEYLRLMSRFVLNPELCADFSRGVLWKQAFTVDGRLCVSNGAVAIWCDSEIVIPPPCPVPEAFKRFLRTVEQVPFNCELLDLYRPCNCPKCECPWTVNSSQFSGKLIKSIAEVSPFIGIGLVSVGNVTSLAFELESGFAAVCEFVRTQRAVDHDKRT